MSMKRTLAALAGLATAFVAVRRVPALRRAMGRLRRRARAWARHTADRVRGSVHRLSRCNRDDSTDDPVLADRVRSRLGPVTRRLDLPHVHVMVQDGIALLHGDVATESDRAEIERTAGGVPGVRGVESYLHLGLLPGDTRPSAGRARHPTSPARQRLELAARRGGAVAEGEAARAVRAVLATFFERIPEGERAQVIAHLPADVRDLTHMPRRLGGTATRLRTVEQLVTTVMKVDPELGATRARLVTDAVLGELARMLPEERDDVAAILPRELRDLWERTRPSEGPSRSAPAN